ncbi:MAG: hypothetical protein CVV44_05835 [Spirochaetae bacterium HGW-Spirochaetae-1]|jgi:hypothetical protein|nr:MAG: hypothetical protein CVV44_05835 [Spirochaetae bacterium HGW-Spirochaetae-1]
MFDSRSPIVRFVGYTVIGFFLLIIIISFGMPDFLSRIGLDKTIVATVNGKKVHVLDFLRYRDTRFRNLRSKEMEDMILNNFIAEVLLLQYAEKLGFTSTDEYIMRTIKEMDDFKDPATGKYSPERFKLILEQNRLSFTEFYKLIKNDMTKSGFYRQIGMGLSITNDDARAEYIADKSKLQIQYAFLAAADLKKQYARALNVTEEEISREMKISTADLKDPKTDKNRIKAKLEKRKLEAVEDSIIERINALAANNGSFTAAAAILQGQQGLSTVFKIGEQPQDSKKDGKPLTLLANSPVFRDNCLILKKGSASQVIKTPSGLFIFTPVMSEIPKSEPDDKELDSIKKRMQYERLNALSMNLMQKLNEESKIIKNLKTD